MATGDDTDMRARLNSVLPPWFSDDNPILNAFLAAAATVLAWLYTLFAYAKDQTRIASATGIWLDIIAQDFFGALLRRKVNEKDDSYRARILSSILRPRATRSAIKRILTDLTGHEPTLIEPFSPADCGAYGTGYGGYGVAGAYGSMLIPAEAFVIARRPSLPGVANVAGYGGAPAGYGVASQSCYTTQTMSDGRVTDEAIYAAVAEAHAAGVRVWVAIQ